MVEESTRSLDSLVVHLEQPDDLLLFVVLRDGVVLDATLRRRIAAGLRTRLSPRHAPDEILALPAIPRTLTGKKLELPVKRILVGAPVTDVASPRRARRPGSIEPFVAYARTRARPVDAAEERSRRSGGSSTSSCSPTTSRPQKGRVRRRSLGPPR